MIRFCVRGHINLLSTHKNTIEFTKDTDLSMEGDCIVGVQADFDALLLKEFIRKASGIKITIRIAGLSDEITAIANKEFDDEHEMVIRKSDFISNRTFAIRADKAAIDLDRRLIEKLKNPGTIAEVIIDENPQQ